MTTATKPRPKAAKTVSPEPVEQIYYLPLDCVEPDPAQPRQWNWDSQAVQDGLMELGQSIMQHGLAEPIVVREIAPNRWRIVAGERRWRAHIKMRGLGYPIGTIRSIIDHKLDEKSALTVAIGENDQRVDMSLLDTARSYARVKEAYGFTTVMELAAHLAKNPTDVDRLLKLLELDEADQRRFNDRKLPITCLLQYHDLSPANRRAVIDQIDQREMTPKQAAVLIKAKLNAQMQVNMFPDEGEPAPVHKGHLAKLDEAMGRMSDALRFFTNSQNPNETLRTAFGALGGDWRKYQAMLFEIERWSRMVNNEMTLYCETRDAMRQQS